MLFENDEEARAWRDRALQGLAERGYTGSGWLTRWPGKHGLRIRFSVMRDDREYGTRVICDVQSGVGLIEGRAMWRDMLDDLDAVVREIE